MLNYLALKRTNPCLMLFEDEIGLRSCMAWQAGKTLSELFGNLTESVWICGAAQGGVIEIEVSGDVIRRDEGWASCCRLGR